ncbi:MAG: TIGR03943 family putative permease subunit [Enterococcus sp.]
MIRFLILTGYFELMMYLQLTGKLDQFINVHYRYLAILSMILSFLLAMVQLSLWVKDTKHEHHTHDGHEHGLTKRYQRVIAYGLLALPIIIGLFFPTVSLDTTIVDAKGFNFPVSKESVGDPEMKTQYLQPNTSLYYNKGDYQEQMDHLMQEYGDEGTLKITDENYLEVMELIYNYPSEFIGRKVVFEGFVYHAQQDETLDDFVFRFGIIHCVADSGVFGLRVSMPEGTKVADDDWVHIEGVIQSEFYQPFKRDLPMVAVDKVQLIEPPENQYVYRSF